MPPKAKITKDMIIDGAETKNISLEQARTIFKTLFLFVHGYASMLANNDMPYDKETISADLELVFSGALCVLKEEKTI